MAKRIPTAVARKQFAEVVSQSAGGARIKLTRYDKTQAVLISSSDLHALEKCEAAARRRTRGKRSRSVG
jgi:hypothetical protein